MIVDDSSRTAVENAIVFRRDNNLKRGVALFGVMLALLSGTDHSHWLCHWGACVYASGAPACSLRHSEPADGNVQRGRDGATSSCSASCCAASDQASTPIRGDSGVDPQHGSCPCPSGCWCQQAPQPLELPKDSSQSSEVLLPGLLPFCTVTTLSIRTGKQALFEGDDVGIQAASAAERCAKLCRFLI